MDTTYPVKIVFQPGPIPEAPALEKMRPKKVEEEIVTVPVSSVEDAARGAMLFGDVEAKG